MSGPSSHAGTFRIPTPSRDTALRLAKVLDVEARATPERSRVAVRAERDALVIEVEAEDARSLRAAMNSFLRLAAIAVDVEDVETFKP